jgi:4-hydroxybenzoate polyprenyltransferase
MRVSETQMKIIALGLIPVFFILAFLLPRNPMTIVLSGIVMITGFITCYLGMSMQDQEPEEHEDLLAMPPKRS